MPPFERFEFYRNCLTLIPDINDPEDHETVFIIPEKKKEKPRLFCSCCRGSAPKCKHASLLSGLYAQFIEYTTGLPPEEHFTSHFLYKLFFPVIRQNVSSVANCLITFAPDSGGREIVFIRTGQHEPPAIQYASQGPDKKRFLSRYNHNSSRPVKRLSRHTRILQTARFVQTEIEKVTAALGSKTSRVAQEESIWFRLAYHCYREFAESDMHITPAIDPASGLLMVSFKKAETVEPALSTLIPRNAIMQVLEILKNNRSDSYPFKHISGDKELLFRFDVTGKDKQVIVMPLVNVCPSGSPAQYHEINERFIYGNCAYLPGLQTFITFSYESLLILAKRWNSPKTLSTNALSDLLQTEPATFSINKSDTESDSAALDLFSANHADDLSRIVNMTLIQNFDRVDLKPESVEGDWCTVSVSYRAGDTTVSLADILKTQKNKRRYVLSGNAIVDCKSESIISTSTSLGRLVEGTVIMHRASLLQFGRDKSLSIDIDDKQSLLKNIRSFLALAPEKPLKPIKNLNAELRNYQVHGVQWLLFLYDYRLGGLLCDDMGLGKTIQMLGLFAAVRQQRKCKAPFLVVCPTTVISHWRQLAQRFTPNLTVYCFYGKDRDLGKDILKHDVILTSYGILRNEILRLCDIRFAVAVFDEAHYIKNQQTFSAQAAADIRAEIKLGLTGTPIENSIADLKSLFDIVLPGYLGEDDRFKEQFLIPVESFKDEKARKRLQAKTSPFILRRLKTSVLTELPPKIEDVRTCVMSEEQRLLYTQLQRTQGNDMLDRLRDENEAVPYMHVFALLNLFRQICCHPVLVNKEPIGEYLRFASGKWDLFCELLHESLDSDQKVVVFSNYLNMLRIIGLYLDSLNVKYTALTGSTSASNRKKAIDAFNNDPGCSVFLGSLKAGGVGIDLTGGSVVIHYDRWWNAAREDQATDRVHRIGQTRGVQIFKLVTEESIEESMAQIIDFKKELAAIAIDEDSPDSVKLFSREELIVMLENTFSSKKGHEINKKRHEVKYK